MTPERPMTPHQFVEPAIGRERSATRPVDPVRILAAIAVLLGGAVHLQQYWRVFNSLDIGPTFLLNGIVSLGVGIALLAQRDGAVPAVVGLVLSVGSLVALLASRTIGLLGFEASGYGTAEYEAVVVEVVALVLLVWSLFRSRVAPDGGGSGSG